MTHLHSLQRTHIDHWLHSQGFSRHHAAPLMSWIYRHTPSRSTQTLPPKLKHIILRQFTWALPRITSSAISTHDGTVKCILELPDHTAIEAVILPEKHRITLCLSSQVGCAQGCVFCATGRMGLTRHLRASEIIGQVIALQSWIHSHPHWKQKMNEFFGTTDTTKTHHTRRYSRTNIVFMGMGEPADNAEEICQALPILMDPWAFGISASKITISTAGHLTGLQHLYQRFPQISYALSLHTSSSSQRSTLMPINRRFPLSTILNFLKDIYHRDGKLCFIQYTLIRGINDSLLQAQQLTQLLADVPCKINLLTFNPIAHSRLQTPSASTVKHFADHLKAQGHRVTTRFSKGNTVQGACGQLITSAASATTAKPAPKR